jgi:hypothetical protein
MTTNKYAISFRNTKVVSIPKKFSKLIIQPRKQLYITSIAKFSIRKKSNLKKTTLVRSKSILGIIYKQLVQMESFSYSREMNQILCN